MALATRLANGLLAAAGARDLARLRAGLGDPRARQLMVWRALVTANAGARFGREHGFAQIGDLADYRARVPARDYDGFSSWITAVRGGEAGVLTAEPVQMLERSGGSTAAAKYIPYTAGLRAEFQRAASAWIADVLTHRPALRGLGAYWSISPVAREKEVTPGGLPVGFDDDTAYFDPFERWVLGRVMRVPAALRDVPTMAVNRYVTLRHLLDRDDLGLVSVWNPSFLTLLVKAAEAEGDRLVRDLRAGTLTPPGPLAPPLAAALGRGLRPRARTADRVQAALRGRLLGTDLWPRLGLVSCWTDALAGRFLPELRTLFPGVEIQGKGLLATEGVVSFPLTGHPGAVVAIDSHFYEFEPEGGGAPRLVDELEAGRRYEVLLTTGGGLWRYRLHDAVEVVGHVGATPLVVFAGKTDKVSDVAGEKLNERHVAAALARVFTGRLPAFAMLAPEWGQPPAYVLHVGAEVPAPEGLLAELERALRENPHYAYARDLGQLGPLGLARVPGDAQARYVQGCEALGQRVGDVKPTCLHPAFGWAARLAGREAGA